MAGKASPQSPSISQLTSQLDPLPSVVRRFRRAKFQPHHGRHRPLLKKPFEFERLAAMLTGLLG
jgi:hypothetical protein